jgi:hypothetical protein
MKLFKFFIVLGMLSLMAACSTYPDITVDYSPDFHAKKVSSYFIKVNEGATTLADQRIIAAMNTELEARGLQAKAKEEADVWISYLVVAKDRTKVTSYNTMHGYAGYGYGYGPYYGGGWGSSPQVSVRQYTEGTLLVDLIDPETNKTVWRGSGSANVSTKRTTEERVDLVDSYVSAIVEKMYEQPEK